LLISDHVESIAEVMRWELPFLVRASPSTVGIALFVELPLIVCLSIDNRFVIADIEDEISPPGGERSRSERNPEGMVVSLGRNLCPQSL